MKVIGHIPHSVYKITIFYFNNRHTIKIEDGLLEQSYAFRDGSAVGSLQDAQQYVTPEFLDNCALVFTQMRKGLVKKQSQQPDQDFILPEII